MDGYDGWLLRRQIFARKIFTEFSFPLSRLKSVEKGWNSFPLNFFELFDILLSSSARPAHCYAHCHVKLLISGQRGRRRGGEGGGEVRDRMNGRPMNMERGLHAFDQHGIIRLSGPAGLIARGAASINTRRERKSFRVNIN